MKENKSLNILLLIAKILIIVILAASFIYFSTLLIDAYIKWITYEPAENQIYIEPFPLAFALVFLFAAFTNGACALLALLGLILSLIYKGTEKRKKNIRTFAVLLASPFALQLLFLLVGIFTGVMF